MIVFKTFLKVLNACKVSVIMYSVILIGFAIFNMQSGDNNSEFISSKANVLIINNDESVGITKNLIDYFEKNSNIVQIENDDEAISDALFYRDVNYIIYIPSGFRESFLNNENPIIEVKSTHDYNASYASLMLERYMKVANTFNSVYDDENIIKDKINSTFENEVDVSVTSLVDNDSLSKGVAYYNFANYSLLAGCTYVICLILSSFKSENIRKRSVISSTDYKKLNRILLFSNGLFAFILWLIYVLISLVLVKDIMFTNYGIILIINSFVFSICALTIGFLIGSLINNKNAISGIINVVALGSSFLCGAFVPMSFIPDIVIRAAHFIPSYYYISNNEMLKNIEVINMESIMPIVINWLVLLAFSMVFIIFANFASKNKSKVG